MKKKLKLRQEVKIILIALGIIAILEIAFYFIGKMDKEFMKNCQEAGYTYNYCIKNK